MTITPRRVLIVGGGIAGAVTALAMQKAGFEPHVFEAHPSTAEGVGAYLTVAVNGLAALSAVDVPASSLGGFETPRMAVLLGNGKRLTEFDHGPRLSGGVVCRTVTRSDLYSALRREAERRRIPVHYAKKLVGAEPSARGVVARFEDGTEAEGLALVGADGIHSRVRTLIDPSAPSPAYVGLLNTGGYARGVGVPGDVGTMHMVFGKRCFYCYIPHPSGEVWWFANPSRPKEPTREELAAISPEAWRAELLRLFEADETQAVELVRATRDIFAGFGTYDLARVPAWHRDRMVIIGDAAHAASPSSGQGASMAIEDGVVLSRCLRDAPSVEAAFQVYETLRRERVERVVAMGRRNGSGKTPGPLGRVARDLALRAIFRKRPAGGKDPSAWLFQHRVEWDSRAGAAHDAQAARMQTAIDREA